MEVHDTNTLNYHLKTEHRHLGLRSDTAKNHLNELQQVSSFYWVFTNFWRESYTEDLPRTCESLPTVQSHQLLRTRISVVQSSPCLRPQREEDFTFREVMCSN
jgi:hypothetical protein